MLTWMLTFIGRSFAGQHLRDIRGNIIILLLTRLAAQRMSTGSRDLIGI